MPPFLHENYVLFPVLDVLVLDGADTLPVISGVRMTILSSHPRVVILVGRRHKVAAEEPGAKTALGYQKCIAHVLAIVINALDLDDASLSPPGDDGELWVRLE